MIIFETIKQYFRIIGYLKPDLTASFRWFPIQILQRIIAYIGLLFGLIPTISFIIFEAENFKEIVSVYPVGTGICLVFGLFSILSFIKSDVVELIDDLEAIVGQRTANKSISIYGKTHNYFEKQTENISFIIFWICVPLYTIPIIVWSLYSYYASGKSIDAFILILPGTFPYDWRTPIGNVLTNLIQACYVPLYGLIFIISPCLYIGLCSFSHALSSDLEANLREMDMMIISLGPVFTIEERIAAKTAFFNNIKFHCVARDFVNRFSNIFRVLIFFHLVVASIAFGGFLVNINMAINDGDLIFFAMNADMSIVFVFSMFILCYYGDNVTEKCMSLGNSIYALNWHLYPIELREHFPLIMAIAQKPIYLKGFCGIECTHAEFKKIMNTSYTFFMAIRRLTH